MSLVQVCTEHDVRLAGVLIVLTWNRGVREFFDLCLAKSQKHIFENIKVTKVNPMEVFDL